MALLDFTYQIAENWCSFLRRNGLDVVVFDSMVAQPMFSPDMYEKFILPLHRNLMALLEKSGQQERELVIGGDTTQIVKYLQQTGANILLCDYVADATVFKNALDNETGFKVRRNINPALLGKENDFELVSRFKSELANFANPIAGTGIIPYKFDLANLLEFRKKIN